MKPLHIAFVTLGYKPFRGSGLDVSGERLVQGLLKAGHRVTVIAGRRGELVETHSDPALQIHRLPLGPTDWIGFGYRAAQLLTQLNRINPCDVAHFWDVHFAYAYPGPYVASLQQSFRQRWATWDRTRTSRLTQAYRFCYYSLARLLAETPALAHARGLLAGSATTRDEFIRSYGIAPNRIDLVPHGIDTDLFRPVPDTDALRTKLGLSANEPTILFAGFVTPRKGLDYLAQALPKIRPAPRLILVGRCSDKYRLQFFRLLGDAVPQVVEAGFVPDEEMPSYYSLADVYVSPSLLEGFGLPLAEALACETPVVATAAGATSEVVGPGGILVPPKDSDALADAISRLLCNPARRREMGMRGREHVECQFSLNRMVTGTLNAYLRFSGCD